MANDAATGYNTRYKRQWRKNHPGYESQQYQKHREARIAYQRAYRQRKKMAAAT